MAASTVVEDASLKVIVKTIDNASYDFEVTKTLQVHKLKERLKVSVIVY